MLHPTIAESHPADLGSLRDYELIRRAIACPQRGPSSLPSSGGERRG
jgi:hypothetical protein